MSKRTAALQNTCSAPDRRFTLIGLVLVAAAAGALVYNAFFGLSIPDESFYLTIPYRLLKGDALFVNEWQATLLTAALQYPLVRLFVTLTGSGAGIILCFRLLFVLCQFAVSCFVFLKMRRFGFAPALIAALLFELYVPEYTLFLDYYTLSLLPVLVIVLLLAFQQKHAAVKLVVCGALFACAVLAEPPVALAYFAYFVCTVIRSAAGKSRSPFFTLRSFGFVTAGVAAVAAAFLVFLFSQETLPTFLSAWKNVFKSGEYSGDTLFIGFRLYVLSLFRDFSWAVLLPAVSVLLVVLDRNRQRRKHLWAVLCVAAAAVCVAVSVLKTLKSGIPFSFLNLPFVVAVLGLGAFLLLKNRETPLLVLWLSGLGYCFLLALLSETTNYMGSYGFVISCVGAVPMIFALCRELRQEAEQSTARIAAKALPVASLVLSAVVCGIFCTMLLSRDPAAPAFGREPLRETVAVEQGAHKGIRLSPQQKEVYDAVLRDIAEIESRTDGKYTVLSDNAWYLFSSDRAPLTYSLWYYRNAPDGHCEHLDTYMDYYRSVGETPAYIYIIDRAFFHGKAGERINVETELNYFTDRFGCTVTRGEAGFLLKTEKAPA